MKLALIGYGKMGRMLEQLAPEYGFAIGPILDIHNNLDGAGLTAANFAGVDAAIEFSTPDTVVSNTLKLAALQVPVVIGTTGWYDQVPQLWQRNKHRQVTETNTDRDSSNKHNNAD